MRTAFKVAMGLGGLPLVAVAALVANWATLSSRQVQVEPLPVDVASEQVAATLAEAVRLRTVSRGDGSVEVEAFAALHGLLEERFPLVHARLDKRVVADHSLLYTWRGSDPSLEPGILLAHMDVVPVENQAAWSVDPFAGQQSDGFVWGRGTLDDKQSVIATLAAVEQLLTEGYQPKRTLYLGYGHDEEISGSGAKAIADTLLGEGVRLAYALDEGGAVIEDVFDGLDAPAAMVGISEKGFANVEIVARGVGGHSSMPPTSTAAGRLAAAVTRLEANPMPASLDGPTGQMLDTLAPELGLPMGLVLANRAVLGPVVASVMAKKPKTNATIRTTTAVTMLEGSVQANVLPQRARAVVNFRIAPGDSAETVLAHVREVIDDPELEVRLMTEGGIRSDPSPVSPADGLPWEALQTAARQTYSDVVVAPYLTIGATDGRHFTALSDRVYRFSPYRVTGEDLDRIHGVDERISVANLDRLVGFYVRFVRAQDPS